MSVSSLITVRFFKISVKNLLYRFLLANAYRDDGGVDDVRHGANDVLELGRGHLKPFILNQFLQPICDVDVTVIVDLSKTGGRSVNPY